MKKKRVLLWLSWWVDSAVSAHLLQTQWYEVIAGFMKNYAEEENPHCHTRQDRDMALKVAKHLWIKTFIIFDFREQYHQTIIQYIYDGYEKGLTPNPDVLCNSEVKFKLFLDEAKKLNCDYVATGHYARISEHDWKKLLLKWIDHNKDQSYFLSGLNQEQLASSLFPLGELTKDEVRKIAQEIKLPNADRKDSQWLCFIGKVPIKEFLQEALPKKPWNIVDTEGKILWQHEWAHFVTIGQRTWLWLGGGPWYVIAKDTSSNTITVSKDQEKDLMHDSLIASEIQWTSWETPSVPRKGHAKIRYRQEDQECEITKIEKQSDGLPLGEMSWTQWKTEGFDGKPKRKDPFSKGDWEGLTQHESNQSYLVTFTTPQRAISPGQIVVLYDGDELVGSGVIESRV